MKSKSSFEQAIELIDAANAADPVLEEESGEKIPRALRYGRLMTRQLDALRPDAPQELRLAVRAQHLERWKVPRDSYPAGRAGYHRWRTDLGNMHAERAGAILARVGFEPEVVERTQTMIRKRGIKSDPDVQALEDTACLVFLEHYCEDFARDHDPDKVVDIIRKTWRKMSPEGQAAARRLALPKTLAALVTRAIAPNE